MEETDIEVNNSHDESGDSGQCLFSTDLVPAHPVDLEEGPLNEFVVVLLQQ